MPAEAVTKCAIVDHELDRQFGAEKNPLSEDALVHLEGCQRCRQLYEWAARAEKHRNASPDTYNRIQVVLKASLKPVSPRPSPHVIALGFFAAFLFFMVPAIAIMGIAGLYQMTVLQMVGMSAGMILGAALLSLSLAWQVAPGSLQRYHAGSCVGLLTVGFLLGVLFLFARNGSEAFVVRGLYCLKSGLLLALPAGAFLWLIARRGAALEFGALGATLGAIAGLASLTVLQFACDRQDRMHLLVWHGGVLAASIILGLAVGSILSHWPASVRERLPRTPIQ